jgi:O-antigen/teichoic acid export membrane protein
MTADIPDAAAKQPSLKRNIVFAIIGRGYYATTQFLVIAIVAQLGTTQDVGALTLAAAIVTPLFFLTSMGLREVHTVDDLVRFNRSDYVALRIVGGISAVGLAAAIVFSLYASSGWLVQASVIGFSLVKFFGAQSSLNHGIFQRAERLDYMATSILIRASLGLAAFAVVFWATRDLPTALFCEAIAWVISYWLVDTRLLAKLGAGTAITAVMAVRPRTIGALALWVLPLGVALWLTRAAISAPPIVLERSEGLSAVGIFGALAYVHTGLSMLANTLGSASAARLRRYRRDGKYKSFKGLARKLMVLSSALGLVAVIGAWLVGAEILGVVFGPEYAERELFTIIVAASAITLIGSPMMTAINASQAFRRRLMNAGATFFVSVLAALVLVPAYGIFGAAWSFFAGSVALLLATLWSFRAVLGEAAREKGQGA